MFSLSACYKLTKGGHRSQSYLLPLRQKGVVIKSSVYGARRSIVGNNFISSIGGCNPVDDGISVAFPSLISKNMAEGLAAPEGMSLLLV